ncbi:hypothetical protein N7470_003707, partial [Penicillium chermesinum]
EGTEGLPVLNPPKSRKSPWTRLLIVTLMGCGLVATGYRSSLFSSLFNDRGLRFLPEEDAIRDPLAEFGACAKRNLLETGLPFLKDVAPIDVPEFENRRDRLAQALVAEDVDAFVVEPGYTFKYYANVSQPEWEVWEAERARLLGMPFVDEIQIVPWEEHWNPYETLQTSDVFHQLDRRPRLMVDEEMRDFIQRGLGNAGFEITGLKGRVEEVRQIKTSKEVAILRAVNTGTVEAVRLYPGLTETQIANALDDALRAAGLDPFFDIVLFDENASNPHGGTNGSKVLEAETFVLIDVGAHLYGYSSDICRTFFPPFFPEPAQDQGTPSHIAEKLRVWDIVFEAQTMSIHQMRENSTAAMVDIAARDVISQAGYGEAFTHRVGHGIGIKAHESPYLNKGNTGAWLKTGMTFTSEPGIYLVDKFGVRHEDVLLVDSDNEPILLTGSRAESPWRP